MPAMSARYNLVTFNVKRKGFVLVRELLWLAINDDDDDNVWFRKRNNRYIIKTVFCLCRRRSTEPLLQ